MSLYKFITQVHPYCVTHNTAVAKILQAQTTVVVVRSSTNTTTDEYRAEIKTLQAARARLQMVIYVFDDGELPGGLFQHPAELDIHAESPHVAAERYVASIAALENIGTSDLPIVAITSQKTRIITENGVLVGLPLTLRTMLSTLKRRAAVLRNATVVEFVSTPTLADPLLIDILYWYLSQMRPNDTLDHFSLLLTEQSERVAITSISGFIETELKKTPPYYRFYALREFLRNFLFIVGDSRVRDMSYALVPELDTPAIVRILNFTRSVMGIGRLETADKSVELRDFFLRIADLLEGNDPFQYWQTTARVEPPDDNTRSTYPLTPTLASLLTARKIQPFFPDNRYFARIGIPRVPLIDCDEDPAHREIDMSTTWATARVTLPKKDNYDIPLHIQNPDIALPFVLFHRFAVLLAAEAFFARVEPLKLPPLPPPPVVKRQARVPVPRLNDIESLAIRDVRARVFGDIPPPIMRVKDRHLLFFVPVSRAISTMTPGLEATPQLLPWFVETETLHITTEDDRSFVCTVQFVAGGITGQQGIRYDVVVADIQYDDRSYNDAPLAEFLAPIAAFYRAVAGLTAVDTGDMVEETRVLHVRLPQVKYEGAAKRLELVENVMATQSQTRPLAENETLFYTKYENCTMPRKIGRAVRLAVGENAWDDWVAANGSLFVAKDYEVPTTKVPIDVMNAARAAAGNMLKRVVFLKKPWEGMRSGSTFLLLFLTQVMFITDFAAADAMIRVRQLLIEYEALISELTYFFGADMPMAKISGNIQLYFDNSDDIQPYLSGLESRLPACPSVVVHQSTYVMMVKLPKSKNGVSIVIGSRV